MMDSWVTVGSYDTLVEAELARNRLEDEGIAAHLSDAEAMSLTGLWAFGGELGGVKLLVAEEDARRAEVILQRIKKRRGKGVRRDDYGLEESITDAPGQVNVPTNHGLEAGITDAPGRVSVPTDEGPPSGEGDEEDEDQDSPKDVAARRAWRAAVFGMILCPAVMHVFSVMLLLEIRDAAGELTPVGRRCALAALLIDTLILVGGTALLIAAFFRA